MVSLPEKRLHVGTGRSDSGSASSRRSDAPESARDTRWPWAVLPRTTFGERCLDLGAGVGPRSLRLAELSDTVVAVDQSGGAPGTLASRPDDESADSVVPIRGDARRLPFSESAFDTIVATERSIGAAGERGAIRDRIAALEGHLTDAGTLLLVLPGWPAALRTALDGGLLGGARAVGRSRASVYRDVLDDVGFEHVRLYAGIPSFEDPTFVFDSSDGDLFRWILRENHAFDGLRWELLARLSAAIERIGSLEDAYPGYLAVCSRSPLDDRSDADRIHVRGRARTVTLHVRDGTVCRVEKRPTRERHSVFVEGEHELLRRLRAVDHPIGATLPEGRLRTTRHGPVYCEEPASGTVLAKRLDSLSLSEAFDVGLDWLIDFQRAYRGPDVERTAASVRADLTFEPAGLEPSTPPEPVELFETPVHGDFLPQNVYVENDRVATVIDWEYGALRGNPVVDAGFYVLRVLTRRCGGLEAGLRQGFGRGSEHAPVVRDAVRSYCDAVDLDPAAVLHYLPAVYLHRLGMEHDHGTTHSATETATKRVNTVRLLWSYHDEIRETLCG